MNTTNLLNKLNLVEELNGWLKIDTEFVVKYKVNLFCQDYKYREEDIVNVFILPINNINQTIIHTKTDMDVYWINCGNTVWTSVRTFNEAVLYCMDPSFYETLRDKGEVSKQL